MKNGNATDDDVHHVSLRFALMKRAALLVRKVPPVHILVRPLVLIWRQRVLLRRLCWRDIALRYNESILGTLWAALNPLLMLSVYTFVFGFILKSRWPNTGDSTLMFAVTLFAGLIVHGIFADVAIRSTTVISENTNYVKKVVFPLETLPMVVMGSAVFHAGVSMFILAVVNGIFGTGLHWTLLLLPIVIAPVLIATSGIAWILASLGVYLRDASQLVGFFTALLLFLSPVFYPLTSFPARIRPLLFLNPVTLPIQQVRDVVIWNKVPDVSTIVMAYIAALFVAGVGLWFFERTRKGFADVL